MSDRDDDAKGRVGRHVGGRMRLRRKGLGRSQARLGMALGVSFQQIQKYERGVNQLSAAKLWALARALDAPVAYFFDGLGLDGEDRFERGPVEADRWRAFCARADADDWITALERLQSPRLRRALLGLIRTLKAAA
jgi:transcriptional regulator with XRE-family HTH domain